MPMGNSLIDDHLRTDDLNILSLQSGSLGAYLIPVKAIEDTIQPVDVSLYCGQTARAWPK